MRQSALMVNEELELCLLTQTAAPALFKLVDKNRQTLRKCLPWVDEVISVEDSRTYIDQSYQRFKSNLDLNTAIILKGELVGMCGFVSIQPIDNSVSVGYWLGSEFEGQGIATTCVKFLTSYAFETLDMHSVRVAHATDNEKSHGVVARCGFIYDGTIRSAAIVNDRYVDMAMYSIIRSEWCPSVSSEQPS